METAEKTIITVQTEVDAPVSKVWHHWISPESITKWCQASDDWHAPYADNDVRNGGTFKTTMAAKDGSFSFDFGGVYTNVEDQKRLDYTMDDERKVSITFEEVNGKTTVVESFEAEGTNPVEMQRAGWQAILDNFRKYVDA